MVWGGIHPTLSPDSTLALECVDYAVRGEGEVACVRLADAIRDRDSVEEVPGVAFRKNGADIGSPQAIPHYDDGYHFVFETTRDGNAVTIVEQAH